MRCYLHWRKISTDARSCDLIGKGENPRSCGIVDQTGCKIDVEDDGSVKIFSADGLAADRCIQMITDICAVAEVGKTYLGGAVVRIVDFGAFVEIFPGTDGLLHISEIPWKIASSRFVMN